MVNESLDTINRIGSRKPPRSYFLRFEKRCSQTSDACAGGRNYYSRPSAESVDPEEEMDRAQVRADMLLLKKLAVDYLHPEKAVEVTDSTIFGRNYFTRNNAPLYNTEMEMEREAVLADASALKQLAVDYMYPEKSVSTRFALS